MREGTAAGSDAAGGMASGGMGGMRTQSSTGVPAAAARAARSGAASYGASAAAAARAYAPGGGQEEESRDSGAESASGADTDTDDDEQASSASGIASWSTPGELACDVDDEDDEEEEDYDDDNQSDTDDAGNEVDDQRASRDSDSRKQDQATAPAYGGLLTDGEAGGSAITTCIHTPMSPYSAGDDAIRSAHFKLVRSGDEWVGYWGKHLPSEKYKSIEPWQKINHFPMSFEIGRKDRLYTNLMAMRSRIGSEMVDFMPETHILPRNRRQLKRVFASHPLWIIKPPASARGNGIRVISKWTDLPKKRELICSRYISDPFLINQRKFDLRLYVVVTSFDPLRIYFYPDGLVRFASEQYKHSVAHKNVRNRFMHLTNYSVSKKHPTKKSQAAADAHVSPPDDTQTKFSMAENKWTIGMLREYMTEHGYAFEPIMDRIKSLLVKTVMSVHAQNMGGVRLYLANRCYELFGFDVLLDSELKPWLMEVNISPSMKASCDMDHALKARVAVDLLNLAGYRVRDLELARHAQTSKTPPPWKRPFLTTSERAKQRAAMINEGFDILSNLTPDDLRILRETEDEARARIMFFARRGDFLRLYPSPEYNSHAQYIQSFNYYDRLLYQWTTREPSAERRISLLRGLLKSPSTMRSSGPVELAHQPKRSPSRLAADKQERVAAHAEAFGEASSVVSNVLDSRLIEQRLEKMLSFNPLYPGRPVATFASHQGMVIPNVQNASTNAAAAAAAVAALRSIVPTKPGGFQPVRHLHPELELFRGFVRAHNRWPKQELRPDSFRDMLLQRVRTEFRKPATGSQLQERLEDGQKQLAALNMLLDGAFETKHPLQERGPIREFLPPSRSFALLDQPAREQLSEKNTSPWTFLGAYMAGQLSSKRN
nr:Tubulin polyglutamylase ttll4 [Polyrhizophydium stewartii]